MNVLEAFDDPKVFAPLIPKGDWRPWKAFLAALFALPAPKGATAFYSQCAARNVWPSIPFQEAYLPCGRRAGKSFIISLIAVYVACFRRYDDVLAPGERATVMLIAADRKQARVLLRYIKGLLTGVPMLSRMIESETAERIELTNRVTIEIATASYRSTRGYTLAAILCDEIAFFGGEESANPDIEILNALRPAMATIPGSMLLCASSPYGRRGALWNAFKKFYGKEQCQVLVWKAATTLMHPGFPQSVVNQALEDDPAAGAAEYLAEFRSDVETFLDRELFMACVPEEETEREPSRAVKYYAFCDPSGGASDSMTLGIAHGEGISSVLDMVRECRPPFSPEAVVSEFAAHLRRYGLTEVTGDRYAGEWVREPFSRHQIKYKLSEMTKNEIYQSFLPLVNSRRVDLINHPRMISQFLALDRKTGKFGRDSIDHAPGAHDDIANAAAGALVGVAPKGAEAGYKTSDLVRKYYVKR